MKYIVFILALLALVDTKIMFDKNEWVRRLEVLASRKTKYKAKFPNNVLLYDGTYWWCDCVNLLKGLFNGRDINDFSIGKHAWPLSNTGDIGCEGMIAKCTDVQTNFKNLKAGEPRVLWMQGHIGTYIGKVVNDKYNVIECTAAWEGGVVRSWVDSDGTRRRQKGGETRGKWAKHGKPTLWVSY